MSAEPDPARPARAPGQAAQSGAAPADAAADPTLRAAPGRLEPKAFPDTARGSRLVLYQTQSGGLNMRWHLDAATIAHAQAAFGDGAAPLAVMRLLQLHDGGRARAIADAPLPADESMADGSARYAKGGEGFLVAEIGLTSASGGWVLIARSNRLQAARPVGAAFLRAIPATYAESQRASESGRQPAQTTSEAALVSGPSPTPPSRHLVPEFPLVSLQARHASGKLAATVTSGGHSVEPTRNDTAQQMPPQPRPFLQESGRVGANLGAVAINPGGDPQPGRLPPALFGRVEPRLAAPGAPAECALRPTVLGQVAADDRAHGQSGTMPAGGDGADPTELAADRADSPAAGVRGDGPARRIRPGSGPIRPARPDARSEIHAELLVYGSGPPGSLIDLGRHAYQIGRGGRFSFRLPINDPELILTLLAALPALPVVSRGEDGDLDS